MYQVRVSRVLNHLYPDWFKGIGFDTLQAAARRGTYYHNIAKEYFLAKQFPDIHEFDEGQYADDYHIVESLKAWDAEKGVQPLMVEQTGSHQTLPYRGTPDLLCRITRGGSRFVGKIVLVDFKFTASVMEMNYVQVSAYWRMKEFRMAERAIILNINPLTGRRKQEEIAYRGNGYFSAFCQGLDDVINLRTGKD